MKNKGTQFLAEAAVIGAIYVVLTLLFAPLSYGEIQIRFSEALTILPFFTPAAIPGLFVGCIIANLLPFHQISEMRFPTHLTKLLLSEDSFPLTLTGQT